MATNSSNVLDANWARGAFCVPNRLLQLADRRRRVFTDANYQFVNTQVGGNYTMNNQPQYNAFTDLPPDNGQPDITQTEEQMSRYFYEAIDSNQTRIHIRAGVPEFNSMQTMLGGMVDSEAESLVRTGGSRGILYTLGRITGFVLTIPLLPLVGLTKLYRFLSDSPSSKYMYLRPTMNVYWNTVNMIVNTIAVKMGITASAEYSKDGINDPQSGYIDPNSALGPDAVGQYNKLLPGVFLTSGNDVNGIDVYSIATKAARADVRRRNEMNRALEKASDTKGYTEALKNFMNKSGAEAGMGVAGSTGSGSIDNATGMAGNTQRAGYRGIDDYNKTYNASNIGKIQDGYLEDTAATKEARYESQETRKAGDVNTTFEQRAKGDYDSVGQNESPVQTWAGQDELDRLQAELEEGAGWVSFGVTSSNTADISVSNSSKKSELESGLNSIASGSRTMAENLMNGNIGDGPISTAIEKVIGGVSNFIDGNLDALGLSGAAIFRGRVFASLGETWESSSVDIPMKTYEMELDPGAGDKLTILTQQIIPLAMVMALAFPRKTGNTSYGPPFLLELYDKGISQSRTCMIDSFKMTRGDGHVPYQVDGMATKIKISIGFKDLTGFMAIPVSGGFKASDMFGLNIFDDEDTFSEQMNCLAALGVHEQLNKVERLKRRAQFISSQWSQFFSAGHMINYAASTPPARMISAFYRSTAL